MHKFYPLLSTVFGKLHLLCGTLFNVSLRHGGLLTTDAKLGARTRVRTKKCRDYVIFALNSRLSFK